MPTKEDLVHSLLEDMTEEELTKFLDSKSQEEEETSPQDRFVDNSDLFTHAQAVYGYQKIPGSNISCAQCGRPLVNDEAHAKALLDLIGGEN